MKMAICEIVLWSIDSINVLEILAIMECSPIFVSLVITLSSFLLQQHIVSCLLWFCRHFAAETPSIEMLLYFRILVCVWIVDHFSPPLVVNGYIVPLTCFNKQTIHSVCGVYLHSLKKKKAILWCVIGKIISHTWIYYERLKNSMV